MDFSLFKEVFESSKMDFILSHAMYCRDVLKLKKGQRAVISNGRVRTSLTSQWISDQSWPHSPWLFRQSHSFPKGRRLTQCWRWFLLILTCVLC